MIAKFKQKFKQKLNTRQRKKMRDIFSPVLGFIYSGNLNALSQIYGSDKSSGHSYTAHYETHLKKFRSKKINFLEIGVGGYKYADQGGASLRMWKKYFPFARIFSFDIFDKSKVKIKGVKIFQGSQVDASFLDSVTKETGDLDVIIDDGSHQSEHMITTFKLLFPKLKKGGVYVVEDIQTSYWPAFGGDSINLNNENSAINFFKDLVHCLNHAEFLKENYKPTYYDKNITAIHFYHNLVFIMKDDNNEVSRFVKNNQLFSKAQD